MNSADRGVRWFSDLPDGVVSRLAMARAEAAFGRMKDARRAGLDGMEYRQAWKWCRAWLNVAVSWGLGDGMPRGECFVCGCLASVRARGWRPGDAGANYCFSHFAEGVLHGLAADQYPTLAGVLVVAL